jgi:hypothetical protein
MGSSDGPVVLTREVALDLIQKIEALQLRCTREIPLVGKRVRLLSATRTNGGKEFVAGEVLEVTEHMGLTRAPHSSYLSINLQDPSDNQRQVTLTDTALTGDGRPVVEVISD